jgi:hypothetical protein
MTLWNKVCPASPSLDDARSGANEGPMKIGSAGSEVLSKSCNWCVNQEMQLAIFCCGNFDLFFRFILGQDPVSSTLCFSGDELQACVAWVTRSCCKR